MVYLNGKQTECAEGICVKDFLEQQGFTIARIALERNGEIVPKARYEETVLQEADKLEVVHFVGGGQW